MAQEIITQSATEPPLEDFLFSLGIDAFWDEMGAGGWHLRNASHGRRRSENKAIIITFAGHAQRNPGPAGAAFAVYGQQEDGVRERLWLGKSNVSLSSTQEEAHYFGLISGLEKALEMDARTVEIEGASEFVFGQLQNGVEPQDYRYQPLHTRVTDLLTHFHGCAFRLTTERDQEVEELANKAASDCVKQLSLPLDDVIPHKRRRMAQSTESEAPQISTTPSSLDVNNEALTDSQDTPKQKRWRQ